MGGVTGKAAPARAICLLHKSEERQPGIIRVSYYRGGVPENLSPVKHRGTKEKKPG